MELRRLGRREAAEARAEQTLSLVTLSALTSTVLEQAARLDPVNVRSLDAIHLATAIDLHAAGDIAAVLTYDSQLQAGCQHHGVPVEAPVG